jgi:hypothetical protein
VLSFVGDLILKISSEMASPLSTPPRDVQGVHPLSYDGAGESFRDTTVSDAIKSHNNKVVK